MSQANQKKHLIDWEAYRKSLLDDSYVDTSISRSDMEKHRIELEQDPLEWMYFFFPKYAKSEFAPFHKKFFKRALNNPEWYEVLSWARELSKSTCVMFAVLYLILTGKKKNVILTSNSYDNAERLIEPYRANLDSNRRITSYYGEQMLQGHWEAGEFKTKKGVAFRALGAGQSPRGSRDEEIRPDVILVDDFDTDEECRNPDTINKKWDWFEQSLYPTRSISEPLLIIFAGNVIAKDCAIVRAGKRADNWDIINIRDKKGNSTWPAKNTEEHIDRVLSKISTRSAQQEYFNNPLSQGDVFKEMVWGQCPPLNTLKFAVVYADPSTSNKDRRTKGTSYKSAFLIGYRDMKYYVYRGYLDQTGNENFIGWLYDLRDYAKDQTQIYYLIENNSLQDPFYEQVFIPLFAKYAKSLGTIPVTPDTRSKPDKYVRIEGNLEPVNRAGNLILNIQEKGNPHMDRLEEQFLLVNPRLSAPADGPDCIEGGVFIINQKNSKMANGAITWGRKRKNTKRI